MYGTFAAIWYFAPGSKSASERSSGGAIPSYSRRKSHHALLYSDGGIFPENTPQRHLSIISPNGRKATFSRARCSKSPVSADGGGTASINPICFRYSGVTESAIVS